MPTHLRCVGSENHHLRSTFLQAVTTRGCRVTAPDTVDATPGQQSGSHAAGTASYGNRAGEPWAILSGAG